MLDRMKEWWVEVKRRWYKEKMEYCLKQYKRAFELKDDVEIEYYTAMYWYYHDRLEELK
jgi:predicted solute-binding protein